MELYYVLTKFVITLSYKKDGDKLKFKNEFLK